MNVIKKPYEISLWDEQLRWYRNRLRAITVVEDNYEPGKYYTQSPTALGALPYTMDFGEYSDGKRYYEINTSIRGLEGSEADDVAAPDDWKIQSGDDLMVVTRVESEFLSGVEYWTFSNKKAVETGNGYTRVSEEKPDPLKTYFAKTTSGLLPNVVGQYYKEKKLCTIGSNTMDTPIRAVKPKLVSKISGENTLDFTVYSHYWEDNELKWNPYMMYLTNERKVKLKYDGKWYDFIIKNISEDSSSKAFTYTCKDLFVNELSKTGFELEFDNELENNMGNLEYLAKQILNESDWRLKNGSTERILQYLEEAIYSFTFQTQAYLQGAGKTMTKIFGLIGGAEGYDSSGYTLPYEKVVYVFYNSIENKTDSMQFLYDPNQKYPVDDKNVVIGYSTDTPTGVCNYSISGVTWEEYAKDDVRPYVKVDGIKYCLAKSKVSFVSSKRGERLVRSQKTFYDRKIDRTVKIYNSSKEDNDGLIYGFEDRDYISAATLSSYVTNPSEFTSSTGWKVGKKDDTDKTTATLTYEVCPDLDSTNYEDYKGINYLKFSPTISGQVLMNTGINDNRSAIGSFTKGEQYVLKLKSYSDPPLDPDDSSSGAGYDENKLSVGIYEYTLSDGYFEPAEGDPLFKVEFVEDGSATKKATKKYICTCNYSISKDQLKKKRIGIFITPTDISNSEVVPLYVQKLEFYPRKLNASGAEYVPGTMIDPVVKTKYCYYSKNATYTSEEDLDFLYKEDSPNDNYPPYYGESDKPFEAFEKVRSITAKESNRFNLLQSLCELFQCWCQFEIEHENNGEIKLDNSYRQKKWVSYKKYIGRDNATGFRYGVNLKSIKRTLDSNGAISKIIVKNNANELGEGGFCSIARADENPSGENVIYNFDYYVGQGLLNFSTLNADLNGQNNLVQGYLGYNRQMKSFNDRARGLTEELAELVGTIANYDSSYQTYKTSAEAAAEEIIDKKTEFKNLTGVEFDAAIEEYQTYKASKHRPADYKKRGETSWSRDKDLSWEFYYNKNEGTTKDAEYISLKSQYERIGTDGYTLQDYEDKFDLVPIEGSNRKRQYYARLKWWDSDEAKKIKVSIARCIVVNRDHTKIYGTQLTLKQRAEASKKSLLDQLDDIKECKINLNHRFYQKYSRFIQEGSWISEDYYDDNLYYIDALSTLYTSSRPQVKYTIDVVDLSQLEGYEVYNFALGDKTYVEDKEFFGRAYDGSGRLYREEVIVSEISVELDSPENNKLTVQNYKTQFEDLFQRVVATTQQIQFSTGEYKRSAAIVQEDGTINVTTLQNSFLNNAIVLQNAKDQSVIIGDDGITTTNLSRPSEMLRIVSGGLFLSKDGGATWTTGISANGINASCITTGQLNVSEVNLTMGADVAFRWDQLGISAYKRDGNGISPGTFTRFDQFGLYGVSGSTTFDPLNYNKGANSGKYSTAIDYIQDVASFGLAWDRFWLRSTGTNGYVSISSANDFEVIRRVTSEGKTEEVPVIKIGRLSNDSDHYGIRISNLQKQPVLETDNDGRLWLKEKLTILTGGDEDSPKSTVQIGNLGIETGTDDGDNTGVNQVINANEKFKVYEDGRVKATSIYIDGSGKFNGTITATGGTIGGLTIEEWKEMGFALRIESSKGWVLREGEETTLTAVLYRGAQAATNKTDGSGTIEWTEGEGANATKYCYKIVYEWTVPVPGGSAVDNDRSHTRKVKFSQAGDTSAVYSCTATLTPVGT